LLAIYPALEDHSFFASVELRNDHFFLKFPVRLLDFDRNSFRQWTRWSLSSDGQTLTMEHRNDDLAGQLTVLD
jgi:hypothetical protein